MNTLYVCIEMCIRDRYDTMMEQINGGMVRVAEMLGKYDAVFIAPPNETSPEDLQAFDMNDYM